MERVSVCVILSIIPSSTPVKWMRDDPVTVYDFIKQS